MLQKYSGCLTNSLSKCLNANQYGALTSWTYNVGCGQDGMAGSTLIRRINNGEDPNTVAQQELPRWNRSGGKVSNGLVNRRAAEVRLFQQSTSSPGNCCAGGGGGTSIAIDIWLIEIIALLIADFSQVVAEVEAEEAVSARSYFSGSLLC